MKKCEEGSYQLPSAQLVIMFYHQVMYTATCSTTEWSSSVHVAV